MYVDDIIIMCANIELINHLKHLLNTRFKLKDLGSLKYFIGLELARSTSGIIVSQCHYTLQLLEDAGMLAAKIEVTPMNSFFKLKSSNEDLLIDPSIYRQLIGRLIYLTILRPKITFVVNKLSQFVCKPCKAHLTISTPFITIFEGYTKSRCSF